MKNIDILYQSYVAKCKEMKIKPGTKRYGTKPKQKILTDDEKRAYNREYARKFRKLHPSYAYEAQKKWREDHPEENRERRRIEAQRRRDRNKNKKNEVIL